MEKFFNLENDKIVEVTIFDPDWSDGNNCPDGVLARYLLVNPDEEKLEELKRMIEHRFDYQTDDSISDEEIEKAEAFCDNIWERVGAFIADNFVSLNVDKKFKIEY